MPIIVNDRMTNPESLQSKRLSLIVCLPSQAIYSTAFIGCRHRAGDSKLEYDVPILRCIACSPGSCKYASSLFLICDFPRRSTDEEFALASAIVADGAVERISRISTNIVNLWRCRFHVDVQMSTGEERRYGMHTR